MKEFTEDFLKEIEELISQSDGEKVRELLSDFHPADIAELIQHLDYPEAEFIVSLLDGDMAADTLMELD